MAKKRIVRYGLTSPTPDQADRDAATYTTSGDLLGGYRPAPRNVKPVWRGRKPPKNRAIPKGPAYSRQSRRA